MDRVARGGKADFLRTSCESSLTARRIFDRESRKEHIYPDKTHFSGRHRNVGQGRIKVCIIVGIVEASDRKVFRNADAQTLALAQGPEGSEVAGAYDGDGFGPHPIACMV